MNHEANKPKLSHLDEDGKAQMVDVSGKDVTARTASASGCIRMKAEVLELLLRGDLPKGEALSVARVAGIQAAKRTGDMIPLCHPLPLDWVKVEFSREGTDTLRVLSTTRTTARTGVEMEALAAVSVACLTLYDMAKAADKSMVIESIQLDHKSGGRSGEYSRE